MRNIRELRKLPISELTDEEILKAAVDRLQTKAAMLVYDDAESNKWIFLSRYQSGGKELLDGMRKVCESVFGKFKSLKDEE